ncbi:MAG: hypothetical protein GX120_05355 [Methanosarcina mazei]|jgi:type I restriction enzyme S subunit|nr:hypothetical protein [Methanosarcina mazei]
MKKNWEIKRLEDLSDLITKGTTPTSVGYEFVEEGINFVKVESIASNGEFLIPKFAHITAECNGALKRSQLKENDILFSIAGALGRSSIVREDILPANTNQALAIIRLKRSNQILPEFILKALSSEFIFEQVRKCKGGVAQQNLSLAQVKDFQIPVPPLYEQQRIISIMDEAFTVINKAKENAEKNLQNSREFFESYLQSVFANPGDGWEEKKLREVCNFVRGPFGGSLKKSCFKPEGVAVYEQQHAIYNQFERIRYFIDEEKFNEMKRFEVRPGDLIMSCSGTMGKVAVVPDGVQKGIINQALLKLSPNKNLFAVFLKFWMESANFQEQITKYSQGAAIQNVASVNVLKEIEIPLPPLSEQHFIVEKLDALSAETKRLEAIYQQKLAALDELKKSVLQKAFNGELTGA